MKAVKDKSTGKLTIKVKKPPIVSHWKNPKVDEKSARQFGTELKKSGDYKDMKLTPDPDNPRKLIRQK